MLAGLAIAPVSGQSFERYEAGNFDFYVLALSWSPSYCSLEGPQANRQQCASTRNFGFVVHGLWPQNEYGYPANCELSAKENRGSHVPMRLLSGVSDIMPSAGLAAYQWRKHGSCSGLTQEDYFATLRKARSKINVPPSLRNIATDRQISPVLIEKAFIAANPGMKADGIAIACKRKHLTDVRICLTKDLEFRSCEQVDRSACRSHSVFIPASR